MGGKTSTSSSTVSIPPEVLARYNSVNNTAQQVAQQPFQQYSTDPNAFVAPLNSTQQAGVAQTQAYANTAQPYNAAATNYAIAGAQPVNAAPITGADINQYMSPYLQTVLGSESALLNQNNQQEMNGALGNAIQSGAFGGDRAGLAMANLAQQQELANANVYSGILNTGYNNALETAQQQQGVNLGAAQANRAANQQTAGTLAQLGQSAQGEGLAGAQAELAAGQVGQQTQQAGLTALYNQFLQQQSYPFQVAQFLANIAEGTGALSGSTTTTTQPQSIFSDERLKEDIQPVGKTFDGQNIVLFRYKGDKTQRMGLIAQDVEKKHPGAVSHHGGYKAVDYGKATEDAARRGHFYRGGLVPANDDYEEPRKAYAYGGAPSSGLYPMLPGTWPTDISEMLMAQAQMYGPYAQAGGLYGGSAAGAPHGGSSYVPAATLPVGHLAVAEPPRQAPSELSQATQAANTLGSLADNAGKAQKGYNDVMGWLGRRNAPLTGDEASADTAPGVDAIPVDTSPDLADALTLARGGLARARRDVGGIVSGLENDLPQPLRTVAGGIGNLAHALYGLAEGGRVHRDTGGALSQPDVDPYDDNGRPGLNIPEKGPQDLKLAVASPPSQGAGGNALGDIASIGSDVAKILPFFMAAAAKRGGRIERPGYDDGGAVDPDAIAAAGLAGGDSGLPVAGLTGPAPHPVSRPVAPVDGLGRVLSDVNPVLGLGYQGGKGAVDALSHMDPRSAAIATAGLAGGDSGLPVAGLPGFGGASRPPAVAPAVQGEDAASAAPVRPAAHHVTPHHGGGLGAAAVPTGPVVNAPMVPDVTAEGDPSATAMTAGDVSDLQGGLAPAQLRNTNGSGGFGGALGALGHGIEGAIGYEGGGHWDMNRLLPLFSGIAAAGAVPTVHPLVALAAGLGGYSNAYQARETQQAQLGETNANAALTRQGILPPSMRQAGSLIEGADPRDPDGSKGLTLMISGRPFHYEMGGQMLSGVGPATQTAAPGLATPETQAGGMGAQRGPITADYKSGTYSIAPGSGADTLLARAGFSAAPAGLNDPASQRLWYQQQVAMSPGLKGQDEMEQKQAQARIGTNPADMQTTHRNYVEIAGALSQLPETGAFAPGAGFTQRAQVANAYTTARSMLAGMGVNLPDWEDATRGVETEQIGNKITALLGPQLAHANDERAASIAHMLTEVMPGPNYNPQAARQVLGLMMVQNQADRDFQQYYNSWMGKYGVANGVNEAFQGEFGPMYDQEARDIPRMMTRGANGKTPVDMLRANPSTRERFEMGGKNSKGQQVPGFGVGSARIWE